MKQVMIIVGLSGAGRTTALRALEDAGFHTMDNPPLSLLPDVVAASTESQVAIGLNVEQVIAHPGYLESWLAAQAKQELPARLIFLECREDVVIQRFSETRRRHPLSTGHTTLREAFAQESLMLAPIRDHASLVFDTTDFTPHRLREEIQAIAGLPISNAMVLTILSFGFRNGVPSEADFVFDVRQIKNPHWNPGLRPKTGLDREVSDYVRSDPIYEEYVGGICAMLGKLLPGIIASGKAYCTIAIGCTGGKHRSVAMAEDLGKRLKKVHDPLVVVHANMESLRAAEHGQAHQKALSG